ncbi:MAG: hypothetical protein WAO76_17715, partial [Georgfuchsia sp.]
KRYLLKRAGRLRTLILLQAAAEKYRAQTGRPLRDLQELVNAGLIDAVPKDPFGFGFAVDKEGQPILRKSRPRRKQ